VHIILVLDATFVPNLTFVGLLSTEVSLGEKQPLTETVRHPAYFAMCYTLRNYHSNKIKQITKVVIDEHTVGASLTILNIRLMKLWPSYAGFNAHISYSKHPSAYSQHTKQYWTKKDL